MGREMLCTAPVMESIPNDCPREAMRSAMHFAAESKHVRWNVSTLQGKVYPLRNPQEGAPQLLLLRIPFETLDRVTRAKDDPVTVANGGESRA